MRFAIHGDLPLFHRFEQGALRARGCPVQFIGQQQFREDGARVEYEGTSGGIEHAAASDICGEQVAGELEATEGQPEHPGKAVGECGFADAWQIFQ